MSWNIQKPSDYINGPLTVAGTATISGDLTVDTSTLKVDSANNRVGIGTATPTAAFDILGAFGTATPASVLRNNSAASSSNIVETQYFATNSFSGLDCIAKFGALNPTATGNNYGQFYWQIANAGSPTSAMTLNSTGLGIGNTPVAALDVYKTANDTINRTNAAFCFGQIAGLGAALLGQQSASSPYQFNLQAANAANSVQFPLVLQPSGGNVGIGVTPSAFSGVKAVQLGTGALYSVSSGSQAGLLSNAYYDGAWKYISTSFAARYDQPNGSHQWYTAASGTAGNAITDFATAKMTLAANGQLLLGTSTTDGSVDIGMVLNKPSATGFVGNVYQFNGTSKAFTYISSAAGAYRVDTVAGYTINMVSSTNGVYLANGGTSWTAISDERFKDIIEPISNAVSKVSSLRSVIGKFKTESEGTRRSFLVAQDVQAVLPEAVDASNPEKLGVSYTEVIPLLVAAIKELTARVQTLEAK